jgi:hypothetical protein
MSTRSRNGTATPSRRRFSAPLHGSNHRRRRHRENPACSPSELCGPHRVLS